MEIPRWPRAVLGTGVAGYVPSGVVADLLRERGPSRACSPAGGLPGVAGDSRCVIAWLQIQPAEEKRKSKHKTYKLNQKIVAEVGDDRSELTGLRGHSGEVDLG